MNTNKESFEMLFIGLIWTTVWFYFEPIVIFNYLGGLVVIFLLTVARLTIKNMREKMKNK